ncbi:leucine-rich repeat protein kinase family protein [Actinidia rufa]|uniref:Leucine-rich repeat protein kinase family protein n=1 Tax=Actinidia rufa TaxID=165716 RepID=A0A7J0DYR7_9ERIC|nr:leucine-rich repeat protein kinase family protein [Actinidia rufa]
MSLVEASSESINGSEPGEGQNARRRWLSEFGFCLGSSKSGEAIFFILVVGIGEDDVQRLGLGVLSKSEKRTGEADDLSFLFSLTNATSLSYLSLGRNKFGGTLTESIGHFSTNLSQILLSGNNIFERIPTGMRNFVNLQLIDLYKNQFTDNLFGIGGFGSVYKRILDQGERVVAVKVLNLQSRGVFKSFIAECKALKSINHRNLVKVLTACSSVNYNGNEFKALVYEFMVNGLGAVVASK